MSTRNLREAIEDLATANHIYPTPLAPLTTDPALDSTGPTFPIDPSVRAAAERALPGGLCTECFGRLFGRLGHGLSNPERADRLYAVLDARPPPTVPCPLCGGIFARLPIWVERACRAGEGFEWHRFTCGSRWDPEVLAREEFLWSEVRTEWGESVRGAFNRELGKAIQRATGAEGTTAGPEIVFLADLLPGRVTAEVLPVYFSGRYRKLDRTLPQTRWPCRRCQGRGCDRCQGTGKMYPTSVEELIGGPVLEATGGSTTRFHGMGREDIDARMLGTGRPFVLEVVSPHVRTVDAKSLEQRVNAAAEGRVEVAGFALTDATEVARVKEAAPEKSYRVGVTGDVPSEKVNAALSLVVGRAIAQRTPTRVAHRRSDRVRHRRIVAARLLEAAPGRFTLDLRTEAGTYVKEWVEGDAGRTEPNLATLVGVPLKVEYLDVLQVHDTEE